MMELAQQHKTDDTELIILGTSIDSKDKERNVLQLLSKIVEIEDVSIDMEDRERVLRIVCSEPIPISIIIERIQYLGIFCYELPDTTIKPIE